MIPMNTIYNEMGIRETVLSFGKNIEKNLKDRFEKIDEIAEYNQLKVIKAMQDNRVSAGCFNYASGYGYDDQGRDTLEKVYASIFHTESALVRPQITCGTHALSLALAANLRPGDELLAPAGSYEGFEAAIGAGADAVYVGGAAFGARAYAKNFGEEELLRAIDTAHIHGRKLYLTVNTLLKNRELSEQLYDYLLPYYKEGLDAVIVQDLGVFSFIRRNFPDLDIHASTQMTVTGPEGMRFLEEKGATRVVPARELSLEEISAMHKASPLEIETFIHGALCYSYSGQCLMSSIFGGRSGNRGRCAQPCRLPYSVTMDHRKYKGDKDFCALSLKDICTLDILPDILEAGVMSLKIEGRMKQPAYTAGVTAVYRKYLDMYLSGKEYHVQENDRKYLLELFSRGGSCKGYYDMYRGPEMMAFANEKKSGNIQPEIRKIKEKIHGNLILSPESPVILEITCKGQTVTAMGGEVQFAKNQPMEEQRIRQQMEKLGNTDFQWEDLNIEINGRIFVPVKVLNEVRRDALSQLREALIGCQKRAQVTKQPTKSKDQAACHRRVTDSLPVYVSCERSDTAEVLLNEPGITGFYFPFDTMEKYFSPELAASSELYLSTPHIHRGEIPEKWLHAWLFGDFCLAWKMPFEGNVGGNCLCFRESFLKCKSRCKSKREQRE